MCELFGSLFGFGNEEETSVKGVQFQKCDSLSGSVQYYIHMNHPKKYQYNVEDIQGFNGFDVEKYLKHDLTQEEQREVLNKIEHIIKVYDLEELYDLVETLRHDEDKTLLDAVRTTHRAYFRDVLYSQRGIKQAERTKQRIISEYLKEKGLKEDPITGRVIHI